MTTTTYDREVRDFDHAPLAALPSYARLRQALSDLGNEVAETGGGMELADWLAAVRDMGATACYGDMCSACSTACRCERVPAPDGFPQPCGCLRMWWPHAGIRNGPFIRGTYRCGKGHEWTCSYHAGIVAHLGKPERTR